MSILMDNPALEWTRNDLLKLVEDARTAVEAFAEAFGRDPSAMPARLSDAATSLHQAYGVLTLLELKPAATLVQHLEDVARAVIAGRAPVPGRALETLLLGILELPDHLEAQRRVRSITLGPLLNVVNALREQLGVPPLAVPIGQLAFAARPDPAVLDRFEAVAGMDRVRRLRAVYQQVLLAALRGIAAAEVVDTLRKVAQSLWRICEGSPQAVLWQVFDEYLSAIVRDEGRAAAPLPPDTVRMLRRMDSELRLLAQEGAVALSVPVAPEHVRQMVANARALGHTGELLDELDAALTSNEVSDALASTGRRALGVAAAALREDLGMVRDALDLRIRGAAGASADTAVDALLAPLRRISSTMAMLGLESARAVTLAQIERLKEDAWTPGILNSIAEALSQVDRNLDALAVGEEPVHPTALDPATLPRLAEIRQQMPAVEQAVVSFAGSNWSQQAIEQLPAQLTEIASGLRHVQLADAALVIAGAARHVANRWQRGETPDMAALDQFAGAITGIDYYLQRLSSSAPAGAADALAFAADSLRQLDPDLLTSAPAIAVVPLQMAPEPVLAATAAPADLVPDAAVPEADVAEPAFALSAAPAGEDEGAPAADAVLAVQVRLAALSDEQTVDADIRDVFLEEVDDLLAVIAQATPSWSLSLARAPALDPDAPPGAVRRDDEQYTAQIRRAFHSLKGSGRLVGARVLGELGAAIEATLNRVLDGSLLLAPPTVPVLINLVADSVPVIGALRDAFAAGRDVSLLPVAALIERAEALQRNALEPAPATRTMEPAPAMLVFEPVADTQPERQLAAAVVAEPAEGLQVITFDPTALGDDTGQSETREIFLEEARDHLVVLADAARANPVRVDEAVVRALHTLAGSAGVVGEAALADLVRTVLGLVEQRLGTRVEVQLDAPAAGVFRQVVEQLTQDIDQVAAAESPLAHDALRLAVQTLGPTQPALSLLELMLALPGQERLQVAGAVLEDQAGQPLGQAWLDDIVGALHGIIQHADPIEHTPLIELADSLLAVYEIIPGDALGVAPAAVLATAHEALLVQFDALAAGQPLRHPDQVIAQLSALQRDWSARLHAEPEALEPTVLAGPESVMAPAAPPSDRLALEALDQELLAVFLEEAEELLDAIDGVMQRVLEPDSGAEAMDALLRALHTLKGGARLAGLARLGDEAHEFESRVIGLRSAPLDAAARRELQLRYDGIARLVADPAAAIASREVEPGVGSTRVEASLGVEQAFVAATPDASDSASQDAAAAAAPAAEIEVAEGEEAGAISAEQPTPDELIPGLPTADVSIPELPILDAQTADARAPEVRLPAVAPRFRVALPPVLAPLSRAAPTARAEPRLSEGDRAQEDIIRVRAALLEELVNLAGESSIVRARLEQGLGDFGAALQEMHTTIQRLREQVRRLEIETEAQILFRRERPQGPTDDDFDPLELDRYSQLQQIARGLAESASDMVDLEETLRQRVGSTEALLMQQARINTQLQEGLMRSRMVPFARLLPRLRRTVRQAAQTLGKSVDLHAPDIGGELDRGLLDRMVAPLEHMLRNAVDHGIESPSVRDGAGKPTTGRIELQLRRDGGDVLIEIADDGAGIDVARVRATAIERGLIAPDSLLGADELRQLIFAPGFSTAAAVTQISGRGVGMDVVLSEVKQLGGSITVSSSPGAGTRFRLRVPFTVSVNRALMARVGDELYAVPLNTIEGVVRMDVAKLEAIARAGTGHIDYAGVSYRLRHLGPYLGVSGRPDPAALALPLLLVRADERAVALQVDAVEGSREIVVKSLGPQFAGLSGVSGATILGDGGVVVILDVPALVREGSEPDLSPEQAPPEPALPQRPRSVLVVDDSVTVRKVMTRLLERNGMNVQLAKDGVEAIAQLETSRPDLMLLDIEMPRMDGFEVLRHVRHAPRLADLPVVMISSRTGAKHRERAAELGVDHFLGKPFKEPELLTLIGRLLEVVPEGAIAAEVVT